ncbi:MAG: ATP-binding cassette domain-containing protein [Acidimicrobiales bacterium]
MNVVEATGLGKRYRSTWALRDCDLAIPKDHVVALIGPNGSGKTTPLHCIVGLLAPGTGTVEVMGAPAGYPQPSSARRAHRRDPGATGTRRRSSGSR